MLVAPLFEADFHIEPSAFRVTGLSAVSFFGFSSAGFLVRFFMLPPVG
jgi:hypothetical protein